MGIWLSDRKSSPSVRWSTLRGLTLIGWFGSPYISASTANSVPDEMEADVVESYMMSSK